MYGIDWIFSKLDFMVAISAQDLQPGCHPLLRYLCCLLLVSCGFTRALYFSMNNSRIWTSIGIGFPVVLEPVISVEPLARNLHDHDRNPLHGRNGFNTDGQSRHPGILPVHPHPGNRRVQVEKRPRHTAVHCGQHSDHQPQPEA